MATYEEVAKRWTHLAHDVLDGNGYTVGPEMAENMTRKRYWNIQVEGDTSDGAENNHYLFYAPVALSGLACKIISGDDVTENDTDYVTLQLCSSDGDGSGLTGMMTAVTTKATGGIAIDNDTVYAPTLTTTTLSADQWLVLKVTKSGAGKALPPLTLYVEGYFA